MMEYYLLRVFHSKEQSLSGLTSPFTSGVELFIEVKDLTGKNLFSPTFSSHKDQISNSLIN